MRVRTMLCVGSAVLALGLSGCTDDPAPGPKPSAKPAAGSGAVPKDAGVRKILDETLLDAGVLGAGAKPGAAGVLEAPVALNLCGMTQLKSSAEMIGGVSNPAESATGALVQRSSVYRSGKAEGALTEIRQKLLGCSWSVEGKTVSATALSLPLGGYNSPMFAVSLPSGGLAALTRGAGEGAGSVTAGEGAVILVSRRGDVISSVILTGAARENAEAVGRALLSQLAQAIPNPPAPAPAGSPLPGMPAPGSSSPGSSGATGSPEGAGSSASPSAG